LNLLNIFGFTRQLRVFIIKFFSLLSQAFLQIPVLLLRLNKDRQAVFIVNLVLSNGNQGFVILLNPIL